MTQDALLQRIETPRPDVTAGEAAAILETFYGLQGQIVELGSQQDRNYRIDSAEGRFVLKICRSDYATVELEAQNAAMLHLAGKPGAPRVPMPRRARNGDDILFLAVGGVDYQVRLLSYLDGEQLTRRKHMSRPMVEGLGALAGRLAACLSDFSHPGLEREVQWDLRRAGPVALRLLSSVTDVARRDRIAKVMVQAVKRMQPLVPSLRVQPIHHDVTDDNIVARADAHGRIIADGVIDFGDIVEGWLAADLAVTCASLLHHADGDPFYILPCIRAFHAACPLTEEEARALWPLIVARACILAASGEMQLSIDPDNDYVRGNLEFEREIFDVAARTPHALMETAICQALGFAPAPVSMPELGPLLPGIQPETLRFADFSVTSAGLVRDSWAAPQTELRLLEQAARETGVAVARYGEFRLTRTELLSPREPESCALHLAICLPAGFQAAAPFAGRIERDGGRTVLAGEASACIWKGWSPPMKAACRWSRASRSAPLPAKAAASATWPCSLPPPAGWCRRSLPHRRRPRRGDISARRLRPFSARNAMHRRRPARRYSPAGMRISPTCRSIITSARRRSSGAGASSCSIRKAGPISTCSTMSRLPVTAIPGLRTWPVTSGRC